MTPIDWLMDSDPAVRWQAMDALTDAPKAEVAAERAKVAQTGWAAQLLARQDPDGVWRWSGYDPASSDWPGSPPWITLLILQLLRALGPDPADPAVASAMTRLAEGGFPTSMPEMFAWAGRGFFE